MVFVVADSFPAVFFPHFLYKKITYVTKTVETKNDLMIVKVFADGKIAVQYFDLLKQSLMFL